MQLKLKVSGSRAIVYDANRIQQPDDCLFEAEHWERLDAVAGRAQGRGNTLLLDAAFGPAVLRQYLRGGFVARFIRDHYLFLGYSRSRPIAEAEMLARLSRLGLPVPEVLGAVCRRQGLAYSGALLTRRILGAIPLAELLKEKGPTDPIWFAVGACIRRFHDQGVYHADLNMRNILVDQNQSVWLIDFDRARMIHSGSRLLGRNLQRLQRSLRKEARIFCGQIEETWRQLMLGYNSNR